MVSVKTLLVLLRCSGLTSVKASLTSSTTMYIVRSISLLLGRRRGDKGTLSPGDSGLKKVDK